MFGLGQIALRPNCWAWLTGKMRPVSSNDDVDQVGLAWWKRQRLPRASCGTEVKEYLNPFSFLFHQRWRWRRWSSATRTMMKMISVSLFVPVLQEMEMAMDFGACYEDDGSWWIARVRWMWCSRWQEYTKSPEVLLLSAEDASTDGWRRRWWWCRRCSKMAELEARWSLTFARVHCTFCTLYSLSSYSSSSPS